MTPFPLLFSLFACVGQCGLDGQTIQRDLVLPNDHAGWVVIEYGVDGGHTPSIIDGREQIPFPASGRLQLSTPYNSGVLDDRFRLERGDIIGTLSGDRLSRTEEHAVTRPIPFVCCGGTRTHKDVSAGIPQRVFDYFYVGTGPAGEPPAIPPQP